MDWREETQFGLRSGVEEYGDKMIVNEAPPGWFGGYLCLFIAAALWISMAAPAFGGYSVFAGMEYLNWKAFPFCLCFTFASALLIPLRKRWIVDRAAGTINREFLSWGMSFSPGRESITAYRGVITVTEQKPARGYSGWETYDVKIERGKGGDTVIYSAASYTEALVFAKKLAAYLQFKIEDLSGR
jgi:hypothetical protein